MISSGLIPPHASLRVFSFVQEFAHCNSTVDVAPWRLEPPQAHVECEPGLLPVVRPTFHKIVKHFASFRSVTLKSDIQLRSLHNPR